MASQKHPLEVIFENYDRAEFEYMLRDAAAISRDDPEVVRCMEKLLADPIGYLKLYSDFFDCFDERGIDLSDNDLPDYFEQDDLLEIVMIDLLENGYYMVEVDEKCDIDDFFDALEELETYNLIAAEMPKIKGEIDADKGVDEWVARINELLDGKAYVIYNDIDTDSYPLTVVSPETYAIITEGYDDDSDEDGSGVRNVIDDRDLKMQLADTALGLLVEGEDYGDLANTKVEFGYLYYFDDHGIESLLKLETDKTIAYFAAQGNKLMRLNFTEELFRSTIEGFLDAHGEN